MHDIIPFQYEGRQFRTIKINGEPWFVGKDLCDLLEIGNTRDAMSRLPDSMKGVATTDTLGGPQQVTIISEAGMYKLAFTSRKEEAERFTDWVASEVLPSIRRKGMYLAPQKNMSQIELLAGLASEMVKQEKLIAEQRERLDDVTNKLQEIRDVAVFVPDEWRRDMNTLIKKAAFKIGGTAYSDIRRESYDLLEARAHCDLKRLTTNFMNRRRIAGAKKSELDAICNLDVIEAEPRLREIYTGIIKELAVKYGVGVA